MSPRLAADIVPGEKPGKPARRRYKICASTWRVVSRVIFSAALCGVSAAAAAVSSSRFIYHRNGGGAGVCCAPGENGIVARRRELAEAAKSLRARPAASSTIPHRVASVRRVIKAYNPAHHPSRIGQCASPRKQLKRPCRIRASKRDEQSKCCLARAIRKSEEAL